MHQHQLGTRATCGTFKLAMSERSNQWHLIALKQTFHQAVVGHSALSVYGQNLSDWSARARQTQKMETEAWISQLRRWSGGDKTTKRRTFGNLDTFDPVTEINIEALTQWCDQHRGMRIEISWRVLRRMAHTPMRHEARIFMYKQAKQIAREGTGVQITMIIRSKRQWRSSEVHSKQSSGRLHATPTYDMQASTSIKRCTPSA